MPKATMNKHNRVFWEQKLLGNLKHDQQVVQQLESQGWNVITIWECEIKSNLEATMEMIKRRLLSFVH